MNSSTNKFYFLIGFLGFSICLASRDFLYRFLIVEGLPKWSVLFFSGFIGLAFGLIISLSFKIPLRIQNKKYQVFRFLNGCVAYYFIIKAFAVLNATSIAIASKSYIPIMILIGPLLGVVYERRQKFLAGLGLLSIVVFAFFSRAESESLLGYGYLLIAVVLVIIEYVMLKNSTIKESSFVVAATPCLSCMTVGGISAFFQPTTILMTPAIIVLIVLSGLSLYSIYVISIYRYRILPLGISEYPSLITALFILPAEYFVFGFFPSWLYLINLVVTLLVLGLCVRLHTQK